MSLCGPTETAAAEVVSDAVVAAVAAAESLPLSALAGSTKDR
jgi:hypothetical protein